MQIENPLVVYLPDTRGVTISHYGHGNLKIGAGVYTYSRLPGLPSQSTLGLRHLDVDGQPHAGAWRGTCPGATKECQEICYAARPVRELGPVSQMWLTNTMTDEVPEIPADAKLLRLHISGDFNTVAYIRNWFERIVNRPDVKVWAYTRSWRVPELLPALEDLRNLPNMQLLASMDPSCDDRPPMGWRRSWIWRDRPTGNGPTEHRLTFLREGEEMVYTSHQGQTRYHGYNQVAIDGVPSMVCPEETGKAKNCEECRYCFDGRRNDVTFLEH